MNFQQALLAATKQSTVVDSEKQAIEHAVATSADHPLLWATAEHIVRRRYHRDTGTTLPQSFDWSTILPWLIKNLPSIISLLMMLFGA